MLGSTSERCDDLSNFLILQKEAQGSNVRGGDENTCSWDSGPALPLQSNICTYHALEFANGDHWCAENFLRWDSLQLNLPGDPLYDPSLPTIVDQTIRVPRQAY
jgi:hypothetical protein